MKHLLLALTILAGTSAIAGNLSENDFIASTCTDLKNRPVDIVNADANYMRVQLGTMLATSLMGQNETPVMLLDIESLLKTPLAFRYFVFFHECAHHKRGHVTMEAMLANKFGDEDDDGGKVSERETIADCDSIVYLVKEKAFSEGDMKEVTDTMTRLLGKSSARKDMNGNAIKKGQFKFYLPIEVRNQKLMECFNSAR